MANHNAVGSNNPAAKIDEATALRIKQKLAQQIYRKAIAKQEGCPRETVDRIANGKSWTHVKLSPPAGQ